MPTVNTDRGANNNRQPVDLLTLGDEEIEALTDDEALDLIERIALSENEEAPAPNDQNYQERQERIRLREQDTVRAQSEKDRRDLIAERLRRMNEGREESRQYTHVCDMCSSGICVSDNSFDEHEGKIYCTGCAERFLVECRDCEKRLLTSEAFRVEGQEGRICEGCLSEDYFTCEDCESIFPGRVMQIDQDDGDRLCEQCMEDRENLDDEGSESIQYRGYYTSKSDKFCSEDKGKIITSKRIFSAEIECKYKSESKAGKGTNKIPKEIGVTHDGSLGNGGIEFQTPLLQGKKGEKLITEIAKELAEAEFFTDKSCGLHIHLDGGGSFIPPKGTSVDTRNHDAQNLKRLFKTYVQFDDVVLSFLPKSRRANSYCKPIKNQFHIAEIDRVYNLDELEKLWYRTANRADVMSHKAESKNGTRYCGVNMHTLISANHLEIRYHSGTINATKIMEWVNLHCLIMDKVAEGVISDKVLQEAQEILDLREKTEFLFSILGLSKRSCRYFVKRQEKFQDRKADVVEEALTDDNINQQ